MRQLIEINRIY